MPRLTFFFITAFWVAMNVLLWRAEYGPSAGEPVPVELVWRKILTAPDISSLNIFEDRQKAGFCELATGVEQEMAQLDENSPPPEGIAARAGYRFRLDGNVALDNFTNRLRFEGQLKFSAKREWRELELKLDAPDASIEIHSVATNQTATLKITSDGSTISRTFTFTQLQNPNTVLGAFSDSPGDFDWPELPQTPDALLQSLHWEARRERLTIGGEPVSVYRLETEWLQNKIVIYASTLGDILRVELPGGIVAVPDGWNPAQL